MLELIEPTARLHDAWLDAHREWGTGPHEDGFGLGPDDDVTSPEGFATWVATLNARANGTGDSKPGALSRWIVEDDRVLGGIALRLGTTEVTKRLGHIGFGIRPSARKRGVARWALGEMLTLAKQHGMEQVDLVCEDDNTASARTIEALGGHLVDVADTPQGAMRFRLHLA